MKKVLAVTNKINNMKKPKAYLASPYGFAESTKYFMDKIYVPALSEVVEVINPWDFSQSQDLGKLNKEALESCDIVIAALDGQEVDSGTAAEVGYAAGIGKKVYGYR